MKVVRVSLIVLLLLGVFWFLNILVSPKYMESLVEGSMISEYYDTPKNHEVLFIGDCEMYANFSPMVLYEEEGISSYIRGSSQQLIWQSYGILKETLKYEKPKVVIFNVNAMRYSEPVSEAYNRLTIDKMKWSKEKIEMIFSSMTEEENFWSYVFPILRYHSRIFELTEEDFTYLFQRRQNTFNVFLINQNVKGVESLPTKRPLTETKFADITYEYLDKIRKLCEENNIELVLIKAPSLYPYWYTEYDEQIEEYASKYGLDYYNFLENILEIGLDYSVDTYDGGMHLNLSGATKLSKYFAPILKEKYSLTDYRDNEEVNGYYQKELEKYYKEIGSGV